MLEQTLGVNLSEFGLILAVTASAAILRAFTGFGFALAAVPVYSLFLPPAQAVVLCASLALAIGIQTFPQYAGKIGCARQWPVFVLAVPGTLLGAAVLQQLESDQFRLAVGALTIVASLLLARFTPGRRPRGRGLRPAAGLASGLMNGAFAIPGPPVIVYIMATESDPARSRAFMIGYFSFVSVLALIAYGTLGLLSLQLLALAVLTFPAMLAGDRIGFHLFNRYAGSQYRNIAVCTCLLIGLVTCIRALI
jgi:uncharacterized membrane protein YfcA